MRVLTPLALLLLSALASAQTFIVDVNNGPGTNFTSIATAATVVPDGSVLIVRVGHYASFAVTGKSLTVLGETGGIYGPFATFGEFLTASITISGLAANQRVVVHGLRWGMGYIAALGTVTCLNCQGSIFLDEIREATGGSFSLEVQQCRQVQVTNCEFVGGSGSPYGARIVASDVMLVDSRFLGGYANPGLQQVGGRVQVVGSALEGGMGFGPGVLMQGGDLRILRSGAVAGGHAFGIGLAIAGSGSVRVDPGALLSGQAPLFAPGVVVTSVAMPDVRAAGGQLGFPATCTMNGPSGALGVLLLGIPDAPLFVPGWTDPLWVTGGFVMAFGVLGSPLGASVAVPNIPALAGQCFGWQGLSIDAAFAFQVSNAAWFVLRA
jgi:hypothetical protein